MEATADASTPGTRRRWRGRPAGAAAVSCRRDADPKERLHACIDRLTRSGRPSLDPADSGELKRLCRSDQQLVELAHSLLCHRLSQAHAQVRLSAFQIVDLLFRRSRRFRELVLDRFERLVGAVLIDNEADSPPPKPVAVFRQLGDLALEAFIDWHDGYSAEQPKLVFAFRFLSQAHSTRLSEVRARLSRASEQRRTEARRLAEKKRDLLQDARQQFADEETELNACLATVANCLELLVPRPEEFDVNALTSGKVARSSTAAAAAAADADFDVGTIDEDDFEAATEDERRRLHGIIGSTAASGAVAGCGGVALRLVRPCLRETPDNAELIEALVTRNEQLRKRLRPRLARWLAVVERCGDDGDSKDEAAQLRHRLKELLVKSDRLLGQVQSLKIVRNAEGALVDDAEDDDLVEDDGDANESTADFEVVEKKDGFETEASAPSTSAKQVAPSAATKPALRAASNSSASSSATSKPSTSVSVPVVPFGIDLLHWGAKDSAVGSATIGYRMDDGGHSLGYRPLDGDEAFEISGSRHMLTMRTMVYATPDEPVRWTCRHPLPDGGLCARMDRLKCPFHGRIVPRDEAGQPQSAAESRAAEEPEPRKKKKKTGKPQTQKMEEDGLVDIRALVDTPRSRLAARVASKAALRKAAADEDARRRRKMQEKFGDQFQYQFLN